MIGKKIIQIERVDSTNNYVANLVSQNNLLHGAVILADEQTAGRGQKGNVWISNPGDNLITSIFIQPANLSVKDQYYLTMFVSISVVNLLRKFGIDAQIKWPNDIIVGNQKIAGILIENHITNHTIKNSIIGIGLNVNQLDLEAIGGTSIRSLTNQFYSNYEILLSLINDLNSNFKLIENQNFEELKKLYLQSLWLLNYPSKFIESINGIEFTGTIKDVDVDGKIIIEKENELIKYDLKEIRFVSRIAL